MALHDFPDHLVAEIAKHLDAASDILALERALESTKPSSPCFDLLQGHSLSKQTEELSSPKNRRIEAKNVTRCFLEPKESGAGQESPARELDASDDGNNNDAAARKNADDAADDDANPPPPSPLSLATTIPTPPPPSLLEEVLRLRWRDAWVLAGLPQKAAVEAGVACAYAAALARQRGGPPVRACALAGYSSNFENLPSLSRSGDGDDSEENENEELAMEEATQGLFGMEMSPTPRSPSRLASSSPSSVFFLDLAPPLCCGGGNGASSERGKHPRSSSDSSSSPSSYRHLPPASAVAAALEALSLDTARLKQAARLAVAEALGPEPPLLRRAYRGFSYSPPEERGGLLLSEDDDDDDEGASSPSLSSSSSSSSRSRSPPQAPPMPQALAPRLGEVSAEFLAWQTAAGHLASAFSSRLARCAAAARGKKAARELARRRSEEEEETETETETERKEGEEAAVAA